MSPFEGWDEMRDGGFPRVSGDEPLDALLRANPSAFSPREWG